MAIENRPNTQRFLEHLDQVYVMYQKAYAGEPWNESLTNTVVQERVQKDIQRPGFESFIAESPDGKIIGTLYFDEISLIQLEEERGEALANFARTLAEKVGIDSFVWERELMLMPEYQRQHIGTRLRLAFNLYLTQKYPQGVMLLTRMRDDNPGTIKSAEKMGYQKTGISVQSRTFPGVIHDYWYKIIKVQSSDEKPCTT